MITVFGLGFVGLTTALGFSHFGYKVYGVDIDAKKKGSIRRGRLPFLEKGLDAALAKHLGRNFTVADDARKAVRDSEVVFFCVGTPCGEDGEADLEHLFGALDETLRAMVPKKRHLLVIKSTVPPSTTAKRVLPYIERKGYRVGRDVLLANNPEFLREGHCWDDFVHADRIVIGCNDQESEDRLRMLYKPFGIPIRAVSHSTAEFIKYLSNSMLATMISHANEMANIAYAIGDIDTKSAFQILHMDKRWNNGNMASYVYPGCGYGGYCLPKDTRALYAASKQRGLEPRILGSVIDLNDRMPEIIAGRIAERLLPDDRIGILGLSFKPGSDDVRDTVSAKIIKSLLQRGFNRITAYDPVAIENFRREYRLPVDYVDELDVVVSASDILVILTAWEEFRAVKEAHPEKVLDFRYM
jgi:UDPglucose 6-dehydrogenase